jgi:hypothetical protein
MLPATLPFLNSGETISEDFLVPKNTNRIETGCMNFEMKKNMNKTLNEIIVVNFSHKIL